MARMWIFSVIMAALALLTRGEESLEPMVAFICNKPAMYSTEHGRSWTKDDSTGCLKDPVDILNYCRKVFPTLDVRNVVEGSEKITVTNWCDFGVSMCDKEFTVIPYRCLVGSFQSDALLVPEHCVFDHIHDSKLCTSFNEWNKTSMQSCVDRGMVQQSFAMLQPCGIDKFNGVEFVCCPNKQVIEKGKDREIIVTSGKQQQPAAADNKAKQPRQQKQQHDSAKPALFPGYKQKQQQKQEDQEKPRGNQWNEHEYYMKARSDMQKHHHDKIAKMMKDWSSARQRVQEMRSRDPKGSDKLNREITSRFQKMYEAEEVESEMEKKQLSLLHQQRVQAEVNEKKEKTFAVFVETLDDQGSDAGQILKALKRYIKTLHKDRMHAINHYQHLEDTDPEEAVRVRQETAEHLRRIDQQLTDALSMLNRVPKFKSKIMQQLQDFLEAYHAMDRDAALIMLAQPSKKEKKAEVAEDDEGDEDDDDDLDDNEDDDDLNDDDEDLDDDDDDDDIDDDDDDEDIDEEITDKKTDGSNSKEEKKIEVKKSKEENDDDDDIEDDDDEEEEDDDESSEEDERVFAIPVTTRMPIATETTRQPTTKSAAPVEVKSGLAPGADKKKEEKKEEKVDDVDKPAVDIDYFHVKASSEDRHAEAANVNKDVFALHQQSYIKRAPYHNDGFSAAVPLGLAVGGFTVFIVIVVGVVLMRRRHSHMRPLRRLGSLDLDPNADMGAISPEERHVASMQMNGYENPTYKYFEQQNVNA